jgi:hypothetical protein
VTCTEESWKQILTISGQLDKTCCAFSILDKSHTYFNGARLVDPLPEVTPGCECSICGLAKE